MRIELDGDYALVRDELIHRTQRLIKEANAKALGLERFRELQKQINTAKDKDEAKLFVEQAFAGVDTDEETAEIILLNQVTEWSFGPVNKNTLDEISATKYDKLVAGVNRLYASPFLAVPK